MAASSARGRIRTGHAPNNIRHRRQFGFADLGWGVAGGPGAGLDNQSWAVDGHRISKWHGGARQPFGTQWRAGDVIGLACDLSGAAGGAVLVSVNGDFAPPNGAAFPLPPGLPGLRPVLTAGSGRFRCNLAGPFRYAPPSPGYAGLADPMQAYAGGFGR
jgi:hypothetical protein